MGSVHGHKVGGGGGLSSHCMKGSVLAHRFLGENAYVPTVVRAVKELYGLMDSPNMVFDKTQRNCNVIPAFQLVH